MRRREFITLLGGAAAWPRAARAQQPMPVIGYMGTGSRESHTFRLPSFHQGLGETGYVEGRNVAIEYRWAEDQYDRLPALAADLVRRQVSVLVAFGGPSASAAKAATTTIPIVFFVGFDPIELGLVAGLKGSGGNLSGVSVLNVELGPKRLELLREMAPAIADVALLINPTNPNAETLSRDLQAAARALGRQLHVLNASTERDLATVFAALVELRVGALVIGPDPFLIDRSRELAALTVRHAVPAIFQFREFTSAGGLMSYGPSVAEGNRQVGAYTGRILKGEKPADLPVQQSTKIELIINLKTAKALGLNVPLPLLGRAEELIE
ncbi:MAG: ABC transporter substrate-binding protein [Hyphomicrobium sp.]